MVLIKRSLLFFYILFISNALCAQLTKEFDNSMIEYQNAVALFEAGNFGLAIDQFDLAINRLYQVNEEDSDYYIRKAELYQAHASLNLELPEAEDNFIQFIEKNRPDPLINQAYYILGNYHYAKREYAKLIDNFSNVNVENLTQKQASEVNFKLGYGHFVTKDFDKSKVFLRSSIANQDEYYETANYYYALCFYFEEDYDTAIEKFKIVENNVNYRAFVPYYITQIYFAEKQYDKVIIYGLDAIDGNIRNIKEIRHLIGQSYYQKRDYESALPHLEYYEANSNKLKQEDFYQLAYTQYILNQCSKAVSNFKELSNLDNEMGQIANYYLADCWLKEDDKQSAKGAFRKVSTMNYNPSMQMEALFNYGKLSSELGFDNEAITSLQGIPKGSAYYTEAQDVLGNVLVNTRDYAQAIKILEAISDKSLKLREAYQKVTLFRGIQLLNDEKLSSALPFLQKSLNDPVDKNAEAQAIFLIADITHKRNKYEESMTLLSKYFILSSKAGDLPDYASPAMANYIQGYNYLKKRKYKDAQTFFVNAVNLLNNTEERDQQMDRVLGDSYLRAGDCFVKRNDYGNAIKYYEGVITNQYPGFTYAMFQKAIILGLQDKAYEKLIILEDLFGYYKISKYADDALLEAGDTYLALQNNKEALEALYTLVSDYPKSNLINKAYLKIGLITYNQGDVQSALKIYKNIFDNNPDSKEKSEALLAIEEIYVDDLQDPDGYFSFVESLDGYSVSTASKDSLNYKVAFTQYENGNYTEAVIRFSDYLEKYPKGIYNLDARYLRAESNVLIEDYSAAVKDYRIIADKGQSNYQLNAVRKAALIYYNHEQRYLDAHNLFAELIELSESEEMTREALLGAMRSAYRAQINDKATAYALRLEQMENIPNDDLLLVHFLIGKKGMQDELYDEALNSFKIVATYQGTNQAAEALYRIAQIYYLRNDLDEAEKRAKESISTSSNYPYWVAKGIILLSDVFVKKEDLFNARAALEAVIENYKDDAVILQEASNKLNKIKELEQKGNRIETENKDGSLKMQLIDNGIE